MMRVALAGLLLGCTLAAAAQTPGAGKDDGLAPFVIGYVALQSEPRYQPVHLAQQFQAEPLGRPYIGAQVAIGESKFPGIAAGVDFSLRRVQAEDADGALAAVETMRADGVRFVLLDLPTAVIGYVAAQTIGDGVALFNVSSRADLLRQQACEPHLFHTAPSNAMRNDALAQYLVSRQWRNVLLLVGPLEADRALARSFRRSAKRQGLNIVASRQFLLGSNPRERNRNDPRLITSGLDYDVVYVADTWGEFARKMAYSAQKPRPVVGAAGLVPQAWHWSWVAHGARQLNNRFEDAAGRHAYGYDWAAWIAVKAIVGSVLRTKSTDYRKLVAYLTAGDLVVDGFKGYRANFRGWNQQLRTALLLASGNWVIARAPIKGFLHKTNYLDTLGFDPSESLCR